MDMSWQGTCICTCMLDCMHIHIMYDGPCVNHNNLWDGYLALLDNRVHVASLGLWIRGHLYSTRLP